MIPPVTSLVKYDNPKIKSTHDPPAQQQQQGVISPTKTKASATETQKLKETDEILSAILPPREWQESGQLWVQPVSSTPATRMEVLGLKELLDTRIQQRQARETGICPVRRELYSQCFDEIIRQVTIECSERGLLLLRVRDEIKMTLQAYQTLYESSVAFGMRKALQSEQGKSDMKERIVELEEEVKQQEKMVADWKNKYEALEKREAERRVADQTKHQEEMQFAKRTNQQLKTQLEGIIAPNKK
ncbi:33 kDa inner dynein arm light chain, axonemal-like [Sycon ciliatum]|uniref:33 kDa inner dynein arm light chain, axonemal-like n=1 Tax=Sycon ciliatum TaxID=27933 RepID=UPI0020A954E2|eukprot:scpid17192/ scgid9048/ 33 kDa inner dynein arm light chain, axonemal; p33